MRLIDADALLEMYADIPNPVIGTRKVSIYVVRQDILNAPTIDPSSLRKDGIILTENELREKLNDAYDLGYQSCLNYKGLTWKEAEELQRYRENPASLCPKGKWEERKSLHAMGGVSAKCSVCQKDVQYLGNPLNYCPNCGANMRGEATPNV